MTLPCERSRETNAWQLSSAAGTLRWILRSVFAEWRRDLQLPLCGGAWRKSSFSYSFRFRSQSDTMTAGFTACPADRAQEHQPGVSCTQRRRPWAVFSKRVTRLRSSSLAAPRWPASEAAWSAVGPRSGIGSRHSGKRHTTSVSGCWARQGSPRARHQHLSSTGFSRTPEV